MRLQSLRNLIDAEDIFAYDVVFTLICCQRKAESQGKKGGRGKKKKKIFDPNWCESASKNNPISTVPITPLHMFRY